MPANGKIGLSVRIGDSDIPEYHKDGQYYVESNLFTPVSYLQEVREMVYGEIEAQEWPVTPYTVKVYVSDGEKGLYYSLKLFIDGVKIDSILLREGESHVFKGFKDKEGINEFLFSLPRFATDENDRISANRLDNIGIIKVEQYSTIFAGNYQSSGHYGDTSFDQANKKDVVNITGGSYTLSTTKKGKQLKVHEIRAGGMCDHYSDDRLISDVSVRYLMGHSLIDKGIKLQTPPWTAAK